MGKYFGTDGIRGKANVTLTVERAFAVGCYLGYHFSKEHKGKILIGRDTRLSSTMFENALAAGITAYGCDAYVTSTCPTPMIAYLTKNKDFSCGVMISASHNPYYDNGIKVFSHDGVKIKDELEFSVEDYLDNHQDLPRKSEDGIGQVIDYHYGIDLYLDYLASEFKLNLTGRKIAVDCANGSSVTTAVQLLTRLGARVKVIHNDPNGVNINTQCGSTHPESLQELMASGEYEIGFAFDGDADRLIAVAPGGQLIDGDHILYVCGNYLKSQGQLNQDTVVTTVMANLGLFKACEKCGIHLVSTQVGDKYVFEEMCKSDYILGGEQSGHIIFKKHLTTGDGLLTALSLLEVMSQTGKGILELCDGLKIYPQLLVNEKVKDKNVVLDDAQINAEIQKVTEELNGNGRILVRPSGTEPLIRVMVEAETEALCETMVVRIIDLIRAKGYSE